MRVITTRRTGMLVSAALLLVTVGISAWPLHVLLIDDMLNARPVYAQPVRIGQRLSLGFTHSVENCRIWDHLSVGQTYKLAVVATEFAESRTGLPFAAFGEEVFERRGDHFQISNMHRPVPAVYQWVDARYDNCLRIDGNRDIPLASLAGKTLLHIRIVKMPAVQWAWLKVTLRCQHRSS